jgi:hypothetical protein
MSKHIIMIMNEKWITMIDTRDVRSRESKNLGHSKAGITVSNPYQCMEDCSSFYDLSRDGRNIAIVQFCI